jgi:hypothetical protein
VVKVSWEESQRLKKMVPTVDELRIIDLMRDYRVLRNRHFGNTIPPVEEVLLRFLPRHEITRLGGFDDVAGVCCFGEHAGFAAAKAILLADDLHVCETRITLLHEMAHMKVNTKAGCNLSHGKIWKKEMRRLAAVGAFDDWW